MGIGSVFKSYVEPSLERIPALEVRHTEAHQGREFVVSQTIHRNVFTEFDRKLSRHLAATRGAGFPAFTVTVAVSERGSEAAPRMLAPAHYASVPHALKGIAERACARRDEAELTINHSSPVAGQAPHQTRLVGADDLEALDQALAICGHLGEAEFLDISGDFNIVIADPPGEHRAMVMHLGNGSISVPCSNGVAVTPFECPIHGFATHVAENTMAQGYLAQVRHALVAEKEHAVIDFRAAAEEQIMRFDRALGGRSLDGFRLDSVIALVERLRLGLGSGLNGLSEDARITALDWAASIASGGGRRVARYHIPDAGTARAAAAGA